MYLTAEQLHQLAIESGRYGSLVLLIGTTAFVVDELAATCSGLERGDLIWPARDGGHLAPPTHKSWLAGAVERCQEADKTFPRVTAHALRHTAVSLAIASGANPKVVQRMLGHASAAMTLDVYADLLTPTSLQLPTVYLKLWANVARGGETAIQQTWKKHLPALTLPQSECPR